MNTLSNTPSRNSRNEKLAQLLGISIQSLELRLWRIDKNKSDDTSTKKSAKSAKKNVAVGLDMAEAKLIGRLMVELDKS